MELTPILDIEDLLDKLIGCMEGVKKEIGSRNLIQLIDPDNRKLIIEVFCFWEDIDLVFEVKILIIDSYTVNVERYEKIIKEIVALCLLENTEDIEIKEIKRVREYYFSRGRLLKIYKVVH